MWWRFVLACFGVMLTTSAVMADETPKESTVRAKVAAVVQAYATAIACDVQPVKAEDVIVLSPWTTDEDRPEAEYAVIWGGSVGCGGGNATYGYGIAVAKISAGNTVLVDPHQSSPMVRLDSPAQAVKPISVSPDTLVLEGKDYDPNDPRCCPSLTVRMTVKRNSKGNWLMEDKNIISPKP